MEQQQQPTPPACSACGQDLPTLPSKLSSLLRLAAADGRAIEATPGYTMTMSLWHQPYGDDCHVCMAGAIMARTLKLRKGVGARPNYFRPEVERALVAVDYLRVGDTLQAAKELGLFSPPNPPLAPDGPEVAALFSAGKHLVQRQINELGRADWDAYVYAAEILDNAGL